MPKNRIYIPHPEIVTFPGTELSDDLSASATTCSVLNNADFASSNLIQFGSYGDEAAEIVTCTAVSGSTEIDFSTTKFAHAEGTVLTRIEYNQYVLERCGTEDGTFSIIRTASLSVDESNSMYVDNTTYTDAWYKYRYYDTALATYSGYSDAFQIEYKENSLHELREMIKLVSEKDETENNLDRLINWYQRKICSQYNYGFMDTYTTDSAVADQVEYDIPSDCKQITGIRFERDTAYYYPTYLPFNDFKLVQLNTSSSTVPSYWTKIGSKILFHNPFSALGTDNITIYYIKFPPRLDSDNDETMLPLADALVNRVAYGLVLASNPQKAQALLGDYQGALNELKAVYGVDQMEEFPQVSCGKIEVEKIIEIDTT